MMTVVLSCMDFMCFMCFMCLARSRLACAGAQVHQTHVHACVYTGTCACMCIHRHMCVHVYTQTHVRACAYTDTCACMCIHRHICVQLYTYAVCTYARARCTRSLRPNGAHLHSTTALRTHPVRREAHKLPNVIQLAVACACTHAYIHDCEPFFDISRFGPLSRTIFLKL
jgi:hypothetical protein